MQLIEAFVRNPVKVAVGVLLVALFGFISLARMPMQLTPEVQIPSITISTNWPGASPQEVEREIVQEQEEQLKGVEGMTKMTAECSNSNGRITLEFEVGTDLAEALLKVNTRLQQVPEYPEDADEPVITTSSSSDSPIAWFILRPRVASPDEIAAFQEEIRDENPELAQLLDPVRRAHNAGLRLRRLVDLREQRPEFAEQLKPLEPGRDIFVPHLRRFAEDTIEASFERVQGVADAMVRGGMEEQMQVIVDPEKLAKAGLTIMDVRRVLREQNRDISGADIREGKRRWVIRTLGRFRSPEQVENVVLAPSGGEDGKPIYVGDVGRVRHGYEKPSGLVKNFGTVCMAISVTRQTGANVLDTMEGLRGVAARLNDDILQPKGLELIQAYDETEYIYSAIGLVDQNILVGGLLTVLVLLLFLRSGRSTIVIALAIPTSLIGTFLILHLMGRSLNVISLAGLAFAVGMLVDNAVVVLENIYRHYQSGDPPFVAAVRGAKEVWGAVVASTLTTLAVFLPVLFVEEEAGQLFRDIALAISSAVGLSLIVSISVIPTAAARVLRKHRRTRDGEEPKAEEEPVEPGEEEELAQAKAAWNDRGPEEPVPAGVAEADSRLRADAHSDGASAAPGNPHAADPGEHHPGSHGNSDNPGHGNPHSPDPDRANPSRGPENAGPGRRWRGLGILRGIDAFGQMFVGFVVAINRFLQASVWRRLAVVLVLVAVAVGLTYAMMPKVEYLPTGNRNLVFARLSPPSGYNIDRLMDIGAELEGNTKYWWNVDPQQLDDWDVPRDDPEYDKRQYPPINDYFFVATDRFVFYGLRSMDPLRAGALVDLAQKECENIPGTIAFASQASLFGRNVSGGRNIDVEISGPDLKRLVDLGKRIMIPLPPKDEEGEGDQGGQDDDRLRVPSVGEVIPGSRAFPIPSLDLSSPEVHIVPKLEQSKDLGVNAADLGYTVDALVDGAYATDYFIGGDKIDLVIKGKEEYAKRTQDLEQLPIATPLSDKPVKLSAVATVSHEGGPEQVNHRERQRAITIQVTPPPDVPLEQAMDDIRREIVQPLIESGEIGDEYQIRLAGTADKLWATWRALRFNFILALLITYLLMAALFESWLYPLVIILSVPLGAVGGLLGLWALNQYLAMQGVVMDYYPHLARLLGFAGGAVQTLDVLTMLGFVILIGTVVNNAILIVHQSLNHMRDEGMTPDEAILASVRNRIRPIFMTTTTTVFGLMPLVLFPGAGSELYRGLGAVVLGGLVVSTIFTLVLVPTVFSLMMQAKSALAARLGWASASDD